MPVKHGDTVRVHYRGTLADGTQFDASEGRDPLEFKIGSGQIIPGFEKAVIGLEPGAKVTVTIEPQDAYGPRHEELTHEIPEKDFATTPYVGAVVNLVSPDGDELTGTIVGIEDGNVKLDFNHPLAGEALTFEIELVEIQADPAQ